MEHAFPATEVGDKHSDPFRSVHHWNRGKRNNLVLQKTVIKVIVKVMACYWYLPLREYDKMVLCLCGLSIKTYIPSLKMSLLRDILPNI